MTFWELIRAIARHWPIVLVGAVLTGAIGFAAVSDDGLYFTRTELVFLAPTSTAYPNALRTQSEDIIITAGAVAKRVSGPDQVTKFSSPDVTLVGMGIRDGWSLRLPDTGGQWATNYATQRLLLDIVAPSRDEVEARQGALIDRVAHELSDLQDARGVPIEAQITVIPAPESTVIFHVTGSKARALGMSALLGAGATIAAVIVLERRRRERADTAMVNSREWVVHTPARTADGL